MPGTPGGGRGEGVTLTVLVVLALCALLQSYDSPAAERREYAYLLVQGTITDPTGSRPLVGTTVRLTAGSRSFEATTDGRGVFVFEKLPIASYEMKVTRADGEVVRAISQTDLDTRDLKRFKLRFGTGTERTAFIEAREDGVVVEAPQPPVRWRRFWTQFAIFVGCAGALAL